jgi:hypothetical protein
LLADPVHRARRVTLAVDHSVARQQKAWFLLADPVHRARRVTLAVELRLGELFA